jgi:HTH-type transcriptional regulator/antitoxin HigA
MIKPIKNKRQYESYLQKAYTLMQLDLSPDSTQSDELELLTILVASYEKEYFTITIPQS